jgi:hypothetical protein
MNKKESRLTDLSKSMSDIFSYLHTNVNYLNNSKVFAGCMIIILNIASRFVNIKVGKALESYLKYTFSKQILVFAIAWMGTRDIYIAFLITILFIIFVDFIFNEESSYCCLPNHFTEYHISLLDASNNSQEIKTPSILENPKVNKNLEDNIMLNKISDGIYNSFQNK